ncbi:MULTISPECIES: thiol-disulfide oxidoreductase DCC family protein [unclassified Streptomyces]|uniref:thiol-disulfide oxidoreductase DCC family protein n=1 Tax=unclassified Streptomyces TaxID=2593676 RepID=UPI002255E70D|nr:MULTISPECIES: DCC1-like thiol-disulfide oxidoreductase family protein [unclassified Streptomyces]MCX4405876.1 DUF393 domain-containing protein [Streptomyces sp. NBC_01764]MCX5189601.1 DUF393 domain-containing protein [Streptomyces sp. NBC_00268]
MTDCTADDRPLTLAYDGDCGFCQASIDRIHTTVKPTLPAIPWQWLPEETTRPHQDRLDEEVLLLHGTMVSCGGAEALTRFIGSSPYRTYRLLAAAVRLPAILPLARLVYRQVARNRHRLPGGTPACALPPARS